MNSSYQYGMRLAIIYTIVWFIDLLDASSLNVALTAIGHSFHLPPTEIEWAIVGFLLPMTIGMSISGWLGDTYGARSLFLVSQMLYIASSIGCGFSLGISSLVFFRVVQGFAAGLAIPLGMAALVKAMPRSHWAKTTACMNMVTLIAPAVGPIFGAYVASFMGWQWIFFLKLPLSFLCLFLTFQWVKKDEIEQKSPFDYKGFLLGGGGLLGILWSFSEVGKVSFGFLAFVTLVSVVCGWLFLKVEKTARFPLFNLNIFRSRHFAYGNIIQSAANTIFLGANFLIALYLQKGIGLDLVTTGWVMASITPGMILVQPLVGKFYNRLGPLPFIVPGLILLSLSMCAFAFTTETTSVYVLGTLVFLIGAASSITQTANVTAIFSDISFEEKSAGSSLYSLFKQVSASFGVALSSMVLSLGAEGSYEATFHYCFLVLGSLPALSLYFCRYIDNGVAIGQIAPPSEMAKG